MEEDDLTSLDSPYWTAFTFPYAMRIEEIYEEDKAPANEGF